MGALYSKISRLHLEDKKEERNDLDKEPSITVLIPEQRTPCTVSKYLLDPRSATAGIKRTPIVCLEVNRASEDCDTTPVAPPLPYLETDLDESMCTIRTSTPVLSASPMKDILQPSPVPRRNEYLNVSNELSISEEDEIFNVHSDDEDGTEQLFNNERMLFESEDQGSFEEENGKRIDTCNVQKPNSDKPEILFLTEEDSCDIDNEVEEILSEDVTVTTAENSLEREFSEIEDCVFSAVNPSKPDSDLMIKSLTTSAAPQQFKLDNHLAKTKTGRTPLGIVSSNPNSPLQLVSNNFNNKEADHTKPWRVLTEERVNRGLLDIENTPPPSYLPPTEIIQSAPGKLLLANRGRTANKANWGRDSSLII